MTESSKLKMIIRTVIVCLTKYLKGTSKLKFDLSNTNKFRNENFNNVKSPQNPVRQNWEGFLFDKKDQTEYSILTIAESFSYTNV